MRSRASAATAPEAAPEFARRVSIPLRQAVGLALLMTLPVLSQWGILGDRIAVAEAADAGLRLRVESPACARYGNMSQMRIRVEDTPAQAGRVVRIELTEEYVERFSAVVARPAETRVERGSLILEQTLDADGRGTPWLFDLTPERYGWARGNVRVTRADRADRGGGGGDGDEAAVTLELATFVLP